MPILEDPERVITRSEAGRFEPDYAPNIALTMSGSACTTTMSTPSACTHTRHHSNHQKHHSPSHVGAVANHSRHRSISTSSSSGGQHHQAVAALPIKMEHFTAPQNITMATNPTMNSNNGDRPDKMNAHEQQELSEELTLLENKFIRSFLELRYSSAEDRDRFLVEFSNIRLNYLGHIRHLQSENRQLMTQSDWRNRITSLERENHRLREEARATEERNLATIRALSSEVDGIQRQLQESGDPGVNKMRIKYVAIKEELSAKVAECADWKRRYESVIEENSHRRRRRRRQQLQTAAAVAGKPVRRPSSTKEEEEDGEEPRAETTETESETETKMDANTVSEQAITKTTTSMKSPDSSATLVVMDKAAGSGAKFRLGKNGLWKTRHGRRKSKHHRHHRDRRRRHDNADRASKNDSNSPTAGDGKEEESVTSSVEVTTTTLTSSGGGNNGGEPLATSQTIVVKDATTEEGKEEEDDDLQPPDLECVVD